jgi:hypothetical protein
MKYYTFLQSVFTDPVVTGVKSSGLAQPFLQFFRGIKKLNGREAIVIEVHFTVEGVESDFTFDVISKSSFQVIDAEMIVVGDVYEMDGKSIEDLRVYLDKTIGKEGGPTMGVPMPPLEAVIDELFDFVGQIHAVA